MAEPPPRSYADDFDAPLEITVRPIGVVRSPHRERHGTPRQACLAADPEDRPEELARIEILPAYREALRDLGEFDRVWVIAYLHLNQGWRATVVPPRGPRIRRGLFATRAPHRPNPIGLSAARVVEVTREAIVLERIDLLDGTPVLDIKPYVPEIDAFPGSRAGWVDALDE